MSEQLRPLRRVQGPEAAKYLGIPYGTLRSMASRGQLPSIKVSSRARVYDLDALDEWCAAKTTGDAPTMATSSPRPAASTLVEVGSEVGVSGNFWYRIEWDGNRARYMVGEDEVPATVYRDVLSTISAEAAYRTGDCLNQIVVLLEDCEIKVRVVQGDE
jgi:excisionase family DNA binding protein